MITEEVPSVL